MQSWKWSKALHPWSSGRGQLVSTSTIHSLPRTHSSGTDRIRGRAWNLCFYWCQIEQWGRRELTASFDIKARGSPLHITASHPGLSATYFCAVDAQCPPDVSSLYSNLQLWLQPTPLFQGLQFWEFLHCLWLSAWKKISELNEKKMVF